MSFNRFIHKTDESGGTKKQRIFRGHVLCIWGSGVALRAWKTLDFELPRHFNIGILAAKIALKHQSKIIHNTCEPKKTSLLKLIYIEGKTDYSLRSTHN